MASSQQQMIGDMERFADLVACSRDNLPPTNEVKDVIDATFHHLVPKARRWFAAKYFEIVGRDFSDFGELDSAICEAIVYDPTLEAVLLEVRKVQQLIREVNVLPHGLEEDDGTLLSWAAYDAFMLRTGETAEVSNKDRLIPVIQYFPDEAQQAFCKKLGSIMNREDITPETLHELEHDDQWKNMR